MKKVILALFFVSGIIAVSFAQDTTPENSLNSGTIESQFEYIYRVSNNFEEYEVVKKSNLEKLKSNILDSLRTMRKEVGDLKSIQTAQSDSIRQISENLAKEVELKEAAIDQQESFSFLGMNIQKTVYSSMMWTLVAALGGFLAFFSIQYFKSFGKVKKAQKDLEDIQEEFDQHRKNTLERERKLKRELIDAQMGKS
ncbi:MAG: hypothetical protein LPK25_05425 [Cyclobacteriaceae bacterium]|nr:hypothetical protein [Cyclobacteriaceae bacterium]